MLVGYLIGLGVVQYLVAIAAGWVAEKTLGATTVDAADRRSEGVIAAGDGIFARFAVDGVQAHSAVEDIVTGKA